MRANSKFLLAMGGSLLVAGVALIFEYPRVYKTAFSSSSSADADFSDDPSVTSCATKASRDRAEAYLRYIYHQYGGAPSFTTSSAIKTVVDCLGKTGAQYALNKIAQSENIKLGSNIKSRHGRMPAQATPQEVQNYEQWAKSAEGMHLVATVFNATGYGVFGTSMLVGDPMIAAAGFVAQQGFSTAATVIDSIGTGLEKVGTYYYADKLFSGRYVDSDIRDKYQHASNDEERQQIVLDAIKKDAASVNDFSKLTPGDHSKAVERMAENGIRFSTQVRSELDSVHKNANELANDFSKLSQAQDQLQRGLTKRLTSIEGAVGDLSQQMDLNQQDNNTKFNFLFDLNQDRMSASQKIYALENFNYGSLRGQALEDQVNKLKSQARLEALRADVMPTVGDIGGVVTILANLGVKSPLLNDVAKGAAIATAGFNAAASFMTGNYIGAISQMTGLFGSDGAGEQQAQIMGALTEVLKLERQILELQVRTIEMIKSLGDSMDRKFRLLDHRVGQVLRLQSFSVMNAYWSEVIQKFEVCEDFEKNWRASVITTGVYHDVLVGNGFYEPVAPGHAETVLDHMLSQDQMLSPLPASQWQRYKFDNNAFLNCQKSVQDMQHSLIAGLRSDNDLVGKGGTPPISFSLEVGEIVTGGSDFITQIEDAQQMEAVNVRKFLSAILAEDADLYDAIIVGAMAPSSNVRDLVSKIDFTQGTARAKLIDEFRKNPDHQDFDFYRNLGKSSSNIAINPHVLTKFIRFWIDIEGLSPLLDARGRFFDMPHLASYTNTTTHTLLKRTLSYALVEQTLMKGDALLEAVDRQWRLPDADHTNVDVATMGNIIAAPDVAYNMLKLDPVLRHNYIRFKLGKAFKDKPYQAYAIGYQMLKTGKDGVAYGNAESFTAGLLINSGLKVEARSGEQKGEVKYWLIPDVSKRMPKTAANAGEMRQAQKALDEKTAESLAFDIGIELPTAEEFYEDRLITDSSIAELIKYKNRLNFELFHHNHISSGKAVSQNARARLLEIQKEIQNASF